MVNVKIQCVHEKSKPGELFARNARQLWGVLFVCAFICWACSPAFAGSPGQNGPAPSPHPLIIPNHTLDTHELNGLEQRNAQRKNMDAANAKRKRLIDDEANKLLILARDLKARTDTLGDGKLTPTMVREAEVIQMLANDVKEKMKLTVSAE